VQAVYASTARIHFEIQCVYSNKYPKINLDPELCNSLQHLGAKKVFMALTTIKPISEADVGDICVIVRLQCNSICLQCTCIERFRRLLGLRLQVCGTKTSFVIAVSVCNAIQKPL
jgi:hypothetical protein